MNKTKNTATDHVKKEVVMRTGWFRPFLLSVLVLILLNTCIVGGLTVLIVRQVITLPPGLISALTGNPSPVTITATTVLDRIQALSDLITTRYNYSSLVNSERELPAILKGLYGDRLLMVAVGHVNAGIDMGQVSVVQAVDKSLVITLPPPKLLDCFLDEKASYVVSRDTGLFAKPAPNLDQEARRYAVAQFSEMARKSEIYDEVQKRAQTLVGGLMADLNVKNAKIIASPIDLNAPLPDTCK